MLMDCINIHYKDQKRSHSFDHIFQHNNSCCHNCPDRWVDKEHRTSCHAHCARAMLEKIENEEIKKYNDKYKEYLK